MPKNNYEYEGVPLYLPAPPRYCRRCAEYPLGGCHECGSPYVGPPDPEPSDAPDDMEVRGYAWVAGRWVDPDE
jgi:hypothetical protein